MSRLSLFCSLFLMMVSPTVFGENAPYDPSAQTAGAQGQPAGTAAATVRPLAVLPTTDTSNLNMGEYLQTGLAALFQQTQYYNVVSSPNPLPSFTDVEVARVMQASNVEIISFAYLEPERITLFLFDTTHPKEFVVVAEQLVDPMMGNQVNQQVVDYKFKLAFNNLLTAYFQNQYQPLPSSQANQASPQQMAKNMDDPQVRADESRRLFRELAALQETKTYLGATLGMARFSGTGEGSASNINFGGFVGYKLSDRMRGEFAVDIFSYTFASLAGLYQFPFAEKYLSLYASFSVGSVLGTIFGPRNPTEPGLNGGVLFGPGLSFDIPLLGANVRGGLRFMIGSGSILFGTYGLSYSI